MGKERTSSSVDFGIRVGAVVARDRSLLLMCHQKPGRDPYWVLPGGRLEPGETIPECAGRELAEETGLTAGFSGVLYVSEFLREGRHTVDVVARMELEGQMVDSQDALLSSVVLGAAAAGAVIGGFWLAVYWMRSLGKKAAYSLAPLGFS